ncbi:MAG: DoxX family protein [Prevotellaceae bacterium]|jgi:putative oxidoreductase|nr:DoxX family protein [Prevotellaceae bacterium]
MIKAFLFPKNTHSAAASLALLLLRVAFGGALLVHGWSKLANFEATTQQLAAMGGAGAAVLVVFAEVFCAAGLILGLLYRLALIPLVINMFVAFFIAHGGRLVGENNGEMAFLYLAVFVALMIAGSGKYAVDSLLFGKKN